MRKFILTIAIFAAGVCVMVSCGGKGASQANASTNARVANAEAVEVTLEDDGRAMDLLNSVPFTEEGLVSMVTSPEFEALSEPEYAALFLAYSKVPINQETLELEKNFVSSAKAKAMKSHKAPATAGAIRDMLIHSEYPQVRGVAMMQYMSLTGVSDNDIAKILSVLNNEKDLFVIKEGIKALSNEMKKPEVSQFILSKVNHENKNIRRAVALAVGNSWSIGANGVKDAALTLMHDNDKDVRSSILSNVGELGDDSLVPELEKVLNDPSQYKLHGYCLRSLYTMWYNYPKHQNTSKAAYEATMNYLKKTPRSKDIPAWTAIGELQHRNDKGYDEWLSKATYYRSGEFLNVMMDIATDPNANWLGRSQAVKVIAKIGGKGDLERLKAKVQANGGDSSQRLVLDAIEKEL